LLLQVPFRLQKGLLQMIEQETEAARKGHSARIIIKVNGLTDPTLIQALYAASGAGVSIDLIVRGMCCLRPGLPGISDNIRVRAIIGRFLEHSRVFYFQNAEWPVYCSSADLMERNLYQRIEVAFPIVKKRLQQRILEELQLYLDDQHQSWLLDAEGDYLPPAGLPDGSNVSMNGVQRELLDRLTTHPVNAPRR